MNSDMWERMRIAGAINRGCYKARVPGQDYTPIQQAFLTGAKTLDDYNPNYFITASGGRELPRKYFKQYGLKPKRGKVKQKPAY